MTPVDWLGRLRIKISGRLLLTAVISLTGMVILVGMALNLVRAEMLAERVDRARALSDVARGILAAYHERVGAGFLDEAEAKARAIAEIRGLRYHQSEYFFIYAEDGTNVLLPPMPEREGLNFFDYTDAKGVAFVHDLIDSAKGDGRPVFYRFPRPGSPEAIDKVAVGRFFAPWGWMIGSGVYLDDLDADFVGMLLRLSIIPLVVTLATGGAILLVARSVSSPLGQLTAVMARLSERDYGIPVPFADRPDEIGAMARAVEVFKQNGLAMAALQTLERERSAQIEQAHRKLSEDVAARRVAEERLRESEQRLTVITENAPGIIWLVDRAGRITYANRGMAGVGRHEAVGTAVLDWVCDDFRPLVQHTLRDTLQTGRPGHCEFMGPGGGGAECWYSTRTGPVFEGDKIVGAVFTTNDISDRKAAEKQIEFLAHHDALTGLPNRTLGKARFELLIDHARRTQGKAAMLFLDLDSVKRVNDSLGHSAGNALLKAAAERLAEGVHGMDTVIRQGADELLLLLGNVRGTDDVIAAADKILGALERPFDIGGEMVSTPVSLGAAVYPDDGEDFEELLRKADTAAAHAKDAGRNTYRFFTRQMNVDADHYLRVRTGLRRALENDEFTLHFQPQIDLAGGSVVGAEALIRWNHPEMGLLAPGRFIPVAEDSGLVVPIGEWVLREACRQAVAWQNEGLPRISMAVNLSAVQFKRGDLLEVVTRALDASALDPRCLELEMTESALVQDSANVMRTVERLKELGVAFSIDDFGTGYSSLAYLRQFKVDKLKIDQSFVRQITESVSDAAIVRAIIELARNLSLRTIAEGIENQMVLDSLRDWGCDLAQGYHLGRPMAAEIFARHLRDASSSSLQMAD